MKILSPVLMAAGLWPSMGCGMLGRESFEGQPGWVLASDVSVVLQKGEEDCGAAALAMVLASWGRPTSIEEIVAACPGSSSGIRAADLRDFAKREGMKAFLFSGTIEDLERELAKRRPVVVGLLKGEDRSRVCHYEVVAGVNLERRQIALVDPARGWMRVDLDRFVSEWEPAGRLAMAVFRAGE